MSTKMQNEYAFRSPVVRPLAAFRDLNGGLLFFLENTENHPPFGN